MGGQVVGWLLVVLVISAIGLLLAASLFTIGILLFIWNFIRHGLPSNEAIGANIEGAPSVS